MGIRFLCPSCRNKVHVKDRLAGLRGFCPTCGAKVDIPFQSTLPGKSNASAGDADSDHEPNGMAMAHASAATAAPSSAANHEMSVSAILPRVGRLVAVHMNPPADPLAGTTGAVWYVVPPDGTEPFGPADSATLNLWLQQGRIVSRSLVWRQDWSEWRKAGTVWSQLALNDVDPKMQRQAERVRGTTSQHTGPQFASQRMPSSSPLQGASPTQPQMLPGSRPGATSLMAQMPGAAMAQQPARASMPQSPTPMTPNSGPQRNPLTAVPASHPPAAAPSSGPPPDGLYYPQRSQKLYWGIVGVLLIGLLGMSVALFYVLDQMKQHKQQGQPAETETIAAEPTTDDKAKDDTKNNDASPTGTRPRRTVNP